MDRYNLLYRPLDYLAICQTIVYISIVIFILKKLVVSCMTIENKIEKVLKL
jgi:hypothetical protein